MLGFCKTHTALLQEEPSCNQRFIFIALLMLIDEDMVDSKRRNTMFISRKGTCNDPTV